MILARNLAPQVSEISVNTARLLLAREQYADAKALLEPVAANPQSGDTADEARELLDRLTTLLPVVSAEPELVPTVPTEAVK
jgi:Flp pilus assembly protein TadD